MSAEDEVGDSAGGGAAAMGIRKPIVMPDAFHGEDLEDWISNFEACSDINGWTEQDKCKFLGVLMKGGALRVYIKLENSVKKDWPQLMTTLTSRFKSTREPELCKSQFLSRTKVPNETFLDVGNSIRTLARKAYPTIDNKIRDELARDQFIRAVD